MITGLMATGRIKWYQIVVGSIILLIIPISYIFLRLGFSIVTPLFVSIGMMTLSFVLRLWFCKYQLGFHIRVYLTKVIVPTVSVFLLSAILPIVVSYVMETGFLRLVTVVFVCLVSIIIFTYTLGLDMSERLLVRNVINKVFHRFLK